MPTDSVPPDSRISSDNQIPSDSRIPSDNQIPPDSRIPSDNQIPPDSRIPSDNQIPSVSLTDITTPLLAWYHVHARDLPWRRTRDPYRIWISEIMLQQTRTAAVLDYYRRFLNAFPDVGTLAAASEEQVFSLWQGLGYYSRARNLRRAAELIAQQGKFPDEYAELLRLPGIGDYTAAAIASAAFAKPCPAVDGNVMRVTARLSDCPVSIDLPAVKSVFRSALADAFPADPEEIRIFNQAVMELGATVCLPNGRPKCERCPLAERCQGRIRGNAERLPVRDAKKPRRIEDHTVFVFLRDGKTALRKRPKTGLLARLWEFPNVSDRLSETEVKTAAEGYGVRITEWHSRLQATHIFTHVEWHMTGYIVSVQGDGMPEWVWADPAALTEYAVPSAFRKFRENALEYLQETVLDHETALNDFRENALEHENTLNDFRENALEHETALNDLQEKSE